MIGFSENSSVLGTKTNETPFFYFTTIDRIISSDEMNFKVGKPWNTEKYCWSPWLSDKKNFRILDALEWLKQ